MKVGGMQKNYKVRDKTSSLTGSTSLDCVKLSVQWCWSAENVRFPSPWVVIFLSSPTAGQKMGSPSTWRGEMQPWIHPFGRFPSSLSHLFPCTIKYSSHTVHLDLARVHRNATKQGCDQPCYPPAGSSQNKGHMFPLAPCNINARVKRPLLFPHFSCCGNSAEK